MKHWKKQITYTLSMGTAAVMLAVTPMQTAAATENSPIFARTEEEWARLRDNKMEYDELENLIHEYNNTVKTNRMELDDFKKEYGKTRDEISDKYRDMAQEIRNNLTYPDTDDMSYATAQYAILTQEIQADSLEKQADEHLEDSTIILTQYELAEKTLVTVAQSNLITYHQKLLSLQQAQKNRDFLAVALQSAQNRKNAESATQMDVLTAQQNLQNADKTIATTQTEIANLHQKLCVMMGWKHDAQPEIGVIPAPDLNRYNSLNPQTDLQMALEKNYTLKVNKRKLENARDNTNKEELETTIRENEAQIAVSLNNDYHNVLTAKVTYDQAMIDITVETQNMNAAERKFQVGTITRLEYLQQQDTLFAKQIGAQTASLNLFLSMESYAWSVNGLANAG